MIHDPSGALSVDLEESALCVKDHQPSWRSLLVVQPWDIRQGRKLRGQQVVDCLRGSGRWNLAGQTGIATVQEIEWLPIGASTRLGEIEPGQFLAAVTKSDELVDMLGAGT